MTQLRMFVSHGSTDRLGACGSGVLAVTFSASYSDMLEARGTTRALPRLRPV
jgi:hypothetical protein